MTPPGPSRRMRRVLFGAAQSLTIAGILILGGWFGPPAESAEPLEITWRQSTDAERQQGERNQLLDVLQAQQEANQEATR